MIFLNKITKKLGEWSTLGVGLECTDEIGMQPVRVLSLGPSPTDEVGLQRARGGAD